MVGAPGTRTLRFGVVTNVAEDARAWREKAKRIEGTGFDTLVMGDHLGTRFAPVPALTAAADATERLRIGTTVFCNEWRNPVLLARDIATLDLLSDGRIEVGIGSGWRKEEFDQLGIDFDTPGPRVERLEEAVKIMRGIWSVDPFSFHGRHFQVGPLKGELRPLQQPHPPILMGVGGPRSIRIAGRLADIVHLTPTTRSDGGGIDPNDATYEAFRRKCELIDQATEGRGTNPERGVVTMGVAIDEDVSAVAKRIGWSIGDHTGSMLGGPTFLAGGPASVAEDILRYREELGISYFVVLEYAIDAMAEVLKRLATVRP